MDGDARSLKRGTAALLGEALNSTVFGVRLGREHERLVVANNMRALARGWPLHTLKVVWVEARSQGARPTSR